MLYAMIVAAPVFAVAGLRLALPVRAERRARREIDDQRDDDQVDAFLAALRPSAARAADCPDLRRLRRARQLGRTDLRLAQQHAVRAA